MEYDYGGWGKSSDIKLSITDITKSKAAVKPTDKVVKDFHEYSSTKSLFAS